MNLRMIATYPATDGSMPESVEVEWSDIDLTLSDGSLALAVLDRLFAAARERASAAAAPGSIYILATNVNGGDLLGALADGTVLEVQEQPAGTKFLAVGKAAYAMYSGSRVRLTDGEWREVPVP